MKKFLLRRTTPRTLSRAIVARWLVGVGALVSLATSSAFGQEGKRPFDVRDLVQMQRISDPQLSPDGSEVVYVLRSTDLDANRGRTDLWSVATTGGAPRRLTTHPASESSPRFLPASSTLLFLSSRSGSNQVWRMSLDGGEAEQITELPLDVEALVVAPDGKTIAVAMSVFPDCDSLLCTTDRLEQRAEGGSGLTYDTLFVRHWNAYKDGRRSHLFVLSLEAPEKAIDVTQGLHLDTPTKPFGGAEDITFTPDSQALVFVARQGGVSEALSTNFDLWWVPADGSETPVPLTEDNPAWDTMPVFSPDGSLLAYKAMARPGYESDRFVLQLARLEDKQLVDRRAVAANWDRSPSSLRFSADGAQLVVTAGDVGKSSLFSVDIATDAVEPLLQEGYVTAALARDSEWIVARDDLDSPTDLYRLDVETVALDPLTSVNEERLSELAFGTWEQFSFAGWNDEPVHGYVVRPALFDEEERYPVAFLIHGGPQGSFGDHWHYRWNPQTYAGAGFAVVMIDFHGSTGYGQDFTDSIHRDWGGKPLEDLKKGLAAALERYSFLDGDRVCAAGASYGGYMINWIAGNWSDRFRCLINHDGVFDLRSMYYSTEELWFPEWDHGGPYFSAPEAHERHNPVRFVENWQTPMLVIHGALDYRVPETQGLAAFTALQRRGVPSRLLFFRDEDHWVHKPKNSIQWHDEVNGWLRRWLVDEVSGEEGQR